MYEVFERLCQEKGITPYRFCKETRVNSSTISTWKNRNTACNLKLATIIAEYFGVTVDYVMTGKTQEAKEIILTPKDERDIARDLDALMDKIETGEDSPLYYNGEEVDAESKELLRDAIGMSLRHLKIINKEKYNPRKNKSR